MNRLDSSISKAERNQKIFKAYLNGTPAKELAYEYDLTIQSINLIVANLKKGEEERPPKKMRLGNDYVQYKMARLRLE